MSDALSLVAEAQKKMEDRAETAFARIRDLEQQLSVLRATWDAFRTAASLVSRAIEECTESTDKEDTQA